MPTNGRPLNPSQTTAGAWLFALDGIDGAGKTTLANLLARRLGDCGLQAEIVTLRSADFEPLSDTASPAREVDWFAGAWNKLIATTVSPLLRAGRPVIMDRYVFSFFAYQSRYAPPDRLSARLRADWPRPDVYFVLDLPVDLAAERCRRRKAMAATDGPPALANFDAGRQAEAAESFRALARANAVLVDSSGPLADVESVVWERVRTLLPARG